jgi:hypothetical protein
MLSKKLKMSNGVVANVDLFFEKCLFDLFLKCSWAYLVGLDGL